VLRQAAEVLPVGVRGMGADRYVACCASGDRFDENDTTSGMAAGCHVGGGDDLEQRGIVAALLADIGVEVDARHTGEPRRNRDRAAPHSPPMRRQRSGRNLKNRPDECSSNGEEAFWLP